MFCKYCGKQIADGAKFCTVCGKELGNASPKPPQSVAGQGMTPSAAGQKAVQPHVGQRVSQLETAPKTSQRVPEKSAPKQAAQQRNRRIKVKARFNIGHVGVIIACMVLILSLFLPNTAENKVYEALNTIGAADRVEAFFDEVASFTSENFDGEISRAVSEQYYHTFPAKSVIENITKRLDFHELYIDPDFPGYLREQRRIIDEAEVLMLVVGTLLCITVVMFILALCRRGVALIVGSVLNVLPVLGSLYICHQGETQLKGTGYIVLVAGACLMFVSALIAHMVRSSDIRKERLQQRENQAGSAPL